MTDAELEGLVNRFEVAALAYIDSPFGDEEGARREAREAIISTIQKLKAENAELKSEIESLLSKDPER